MRCAERAPVVAASAEGGDVVGGEAVGVRVLQVGVDPVAAYSAGVLSLLDAAAVALVAAVTGARHATSFG